MNNSRTAVRARVTLLSSTSPANAGRWVKEVSCGISSFADFFRRDLLLGTHGRVMKDRIWRLLPGADGEARIEENAHR